MEYNNIHELMEAIRLEAIKLAQLAGLPPEDYAELLEQGKTAEQTIQELTLSEMIGVPVRIK